MKRFRKIAIVALSLICVLCAAFAFGCADKTTYYTVTFMDGQTQVGESLKVKKGGKITEYPTAERDDPDDVFDGWFKDDGLTKVWDHDIERVTKDITLWANFLHVSATPNNVAMTDTAFSNTVSWLQRGITEESGFTVKILDTEIVSGGKEEFAFESYKGHTDIYTVKWTPSVKPAGGTYSVEIDDGNTEKVKVDNLIFKGAGEENNPYLLYSQTDLADVNKVDVAGGYYKLAQSFTAKSSSGEIAGNTFNGKLDGDGKSITLEAADFGLFGILGTNSEVKDLTVAGAIGNAQTNCVGAIAGVNRGEISYCTVSATLDSTMGSVGALSGDKDGIDGGIAGIAGINYGKISCCGYSGTLTASVGGAGISVINNGIVSLCSFTGTMGAKNATEAGSSTKKYSYLGGIVSINYATVEKSSTDGSGKILAQRGEDGLNDYVGGIVAVNQTGATVKECLFDGIRVHGNKNVGGIAGANFGTVTHCYAGGSYHGGNATTRSYAGGLSEVGGIAGLDGGGTVTNCFVTSNVYAYSGNAYKVAKNAANSIFVGGNLENKDGAVAVTESEGNGNIKIDITDDYAAKNYPLVLTDEQLAALNGDTEAFVNKNNVRLACENESTEIEHIITVYLNGAIIGTASSVSGNKVSLKAHTPAVIPENHYFAGWAVTDGGEVVFAENSELNYSSLANYGSDSVTVYPVFISGEKPQSKVLNVALWTRYFKEDTANALFEAFKSSSYFKDGYTVEYTALTSSNNNNFKTDYEKGDFNVAFGYKSQTVNDWQVTILEIYAFSVSDNAYATLRVGLNSSDDAVKDFGEFLQTDTAKKIMNPAYVSESEAQKIEITLISNGEQYGEKLTVSNATEAEKISLPAIEEMPAGYTAFLGWATTETAEENETLLTGKKGYDDLKDLAANGELTLYARFTEEEQAEIVLRVAVYNRYITEQEYAKDLIAKFIAANGLEAEQIVLDFLGEKDTGAADFGAAVNDGTYDIVLACGNNIDSTCGVEITKKKGITVKGQTNRYIAILTESETAQAFYEFVDTATGKKALNPDYITEAEADKIEITLMIGQTQYGEKLTASNATEAEKISLPAIEDIPAGYTAFLGWATTETAEENETLLTGKKGYDDLKDLAANGALTLYARFTQEEQAGTALRVALWTKYFKEDTANALFEAFKSSSYFKDGYTVEYTALTSDKNADFKADYDKGDFNVAFGYKAQAVNDWQVNILEIYAFSVSDNAYTTLRVGLNSSDDAVKDFGEFLQTDTAKKIMNPAYVSESEAQKIEITLMSNGEQYGEKLTASEATEAENITLPTLEPEEGFTFEGWALAEAASENETLLKGEKSYDDLKDFATDNALTLYARFTQNKDDDKTVLTVGYWTYGNVVTSEVAQNLLKEFENYAKENELNFTIVFKEYDVATYAKVADLVNKITADGNVDYILGIGKSSGDLQFVSGTKVQVGERYVAQLTDSDDAQALHTYFMQSAILKAAKGDK